MIERVVLHNWKSHRRTNVEFKAGTNVIIGINGAGKSSVLEGTFFALFGPPEKKGFYERVLREGEKEGFVELVFSQGGKRYRVRREFDRKGQKRARLDGDVKVITNRPKDVDEKIIEILGMDGKMFRDSVYARQNEMASILLDGKRRKEMIDDMIEVSEFSRVRDAVVALRNRLRDWIQGAETFDFDGRLKELSAQMERKIRAKDGKEKELEEMEGRASDLEKTLKELEERTEGAREEYKKLQGLRSRLQEVRGELLTAKEKIKELGEEVGAPTGEEQEELKKLQEDHRIVKEMENQLTALRSKADATERMLREKLKIVESRGDEGISIEELNKRIENIEEELKKLEDEMRKESQKSAVLEAEIINLKNREEELKKEVDRIEKLSAELRSLEEKYGDVEEAIAEGERRIREASEEIAGAKSRILQEEEFVRALEGRESCPVCSSELGKERAEKLREEHRRKEKELEAFVKGKEEELKKEEGRLRELRAVAEQISRLRQSVEGIDEKRDELAKIKKRGEAVEKEILWARRRVEELTRRRSELMGEIAEARKRKEFEVRIASAKEDARRLEEEIKRIEGEIGELERQLSGRSSEEISARIKIVEKRVELAKWLERENALEREEVDLKGAVEDLKGAEEEYRQIIEERAGKEAELKSARSRVLAIKSEIIELEKDLHSVEREIKRVEEQKASVEKRRATLSILNRMLPAVEMAREQVRELRIKAINKALNIVWRGLYPRGDLSEIRLRPEGSDYVFEAKRGNNWVSVVGLSGGEFYDTALALRIAISSLKAKNVGILILDEPTHNLDVDATEALTHILNKLPEYGLFKQIIVITHNDLLRDAATGTIHIFERDKDRNSPTEVRK